MKELTVSAKEEGISLIKYLNKVLPNAGTSFLYKMLRKKNILLNAKKADGNEKLTARDVISVYFSDETFDKFHGNEGEALEKDVHGKKLPKIYSLVTVVFENEDILIVDKPAGLLSQKAQRNDLSLNDWLLTYLHVNKNKDIFIPSVCNRLDRNTSGMVLCSKSLKGAQYLSNLLKSRELEKYYFAICEGHITKAQDVFSYLSKDASHNKVYISDAPKEGYSEIHTSYEPLFYHASHNITLIKIHLYTGKSHQIRAHLAHLGHPILGDYKYGSENFRALCEKFGVKAQLLHAGEVCFPKDDSSVSGLRVCVNVPDLFNKVMEDAHGNLEF